MSGLSNAQPYDCPGSARNFRRAEAVPKGSFAPFPRMGQAAALQAARGCGVASGAARGAQRLLAGLGGEGPWGGES